MPWSWHNGITAYIGYTTAIMARYLPGGRQDDMPPCDGSSTVEYCFAANQAIMDPKIVADLRPSADGSAVHTSLVAGGG